MPLLLPPLQTLPPLKRLLHPPPQMPLLPPQQQLLRLWPCQSLRIRPLRCHPPQQVTRQPLPLTLLLQLPPLMLLQPPLQTPLLQLPPQMPLL